MTIYIPQHLRKLEIVQLLISMLEAYENFSVSSSDADFDQYYYLYSKDPVLRFVEMCIPRETWNSELSYEDTINYIVNRFYHLKGTKAIFDLLPEYLGFNVKVDTNILFLDGCIKLELSEITVSDINSWQTAFKSFLDHLLYYNDIKLYLDKINLDIEGVIGQNEAHNIIIYNLIDV